MASERKEAFMATTMVNVRMDEQTKKDMEAVCKELGMSMTTAFTIYAKKVDPFYSEENIAHIRRGAKALDEGRGISHELADDGE
jgi:DNA-damage-inducible protein J